MKNSYITFDVHPTSMTAPVGLEILLNNAVIYNNETVTQSETIQIKIPDNEGEHSLKIVLKNKTSEHTVLNSLGAIVQDSTVVVKNIKFDDIEIGHNIQQLMTYVHDCNGTDQLKPHKFYGEMGCNGTVELKFKSPIYLWLLEHL